MDIIENFHSLETCVVRRTQIRALHLRTKPLLFEEILKNQTTKLLILSLAITDYPLIALRTEHMQPPMGTHPDRENILNIHPFHPSPSTAVSAIQCRQLPPLWQTIRLPPLLSNR